MNASAHSVEAEPADRAVNHAVALLLRAEVKAFLVRIGEQSAEDAVADLFPPCACDDERVKRWEQEYPHTPTPNQQERPMVEAPAATVDALMYELREDGVAALLTPGCQRRLTAISSDQVLDVIARLNRLRPQYPRITGELILRIGERAQ